MSAVILRHENVMWFHAHHADFLPLPTDAETVSHPIIYPMQNSNGLARGLSDLSVRWFKHVYCRSKAVFLLWTFLLFMFCVFYAVLFVHCGHLLLKGWPLGSLVCDVFLCYTFSHVLSWVRFGT